MLAIWHFLLLFSIVQALTLALLLVLLPLHVLLTSASFLYPSANLSMCISRAAAHSGLPRPKSPMHHPPNVSSHFRCHWYTHTLPMEQWVMRTWEMGLERWETWRAHLGAYEHTRMRPPTPWRFWLLRFWLLQEVSCEQPVHRKKTSIFFLSSSLSYEHWWWWHPKKHIPILPWQKSKSHWKWCRAE